MTTPPVPAAACAQARSEEESYFVTQDHPLQGASPHGTATRRYPLLGRVTSLPYEGLSTPQTAVEVLVARPAAAANAAPAAPAAPHGGAGITAGEATAGEATAGEATAGEATGLWKLVRTFDPADPAGGEHLALFDLDADPAERRNLARGVGPSRGAAGPGGAGRAGPCPSGAVEAEMRRRLALARVRHGGELTGPEEQAYAK